MSGDGGRDPQVRQDTGAARYAFTVGRDLTIVHQNDPDQGQPKVPRMVWGSAGGNQELRVHFFWIAE
jgi:hypothetical protein